MPQLRQDRLFPQNKVALSIAQNLYKEIINENIILDARETVKIQWLYKNQIVKSSELKKDSLKLQLTWNSVQKEMFNRNFGEKVL